MRLIHTQRFARDSQTQINGIDFFNVVICWTGCEIQLSAGAFCSEPAGGSMAHTLCDPQMMKHSERRTQIRIQMHFGNVWKVEQQLEQSLLNEKESPRRLTGGLFTAN